MYTLGKQDYGLTSQHSSTPAIQRTAFKSRFYDDGVPSVRCHYTEMQQKFGVTPDKADRGTKFRMCGDILNKYPFPTIKIRGEDVELKETSKHSLMCGLSSFQANDIETSDYYAGRFTDDLNIALGRNITDVMRKFKLKSGIFAQVHPVNPEHEIFVRAPHLDFDWRCVPMSDHHSSMPKESYEAYKFAMKNEFPLDDLRIALPKPRPQPQKLGFFREMVDELTDPYFIMAVRADLFTGFYPTRELYVYLHWWL